MLLTVSLIFVDLGLSFLYHFYILKSIICILVPPKGDEILHSRAGGVDDDYILVDVPKPKVHYYAAVAHPLPSALEA